MTDIKKPQHKEYQAKRFFVSPLNSYFGNVLVETLRNDDKYPDNPNLIVGTVTESKKYNVPTAVRKVIDPTKIEFLQRVFLESDVIVYDLLNCDLDEVEFAIKSTLKLILKL